MALGQDLQLGGRSVHVGVVAEEGSQPAQGGVIVVREMGSDRTAPPASQGVGHRLQEGIQQNAWRGGGVALVHLGAADGRHSCLQARQARGILRPVQHRQPAGVKGAACGIGRRQYRGQFLGSQGLQYQGGHHLPVAGVGGQGDGRRQAFGPRQANESEQGRGGREPQARARAPETAASSHPGPNRAVGPGMAGGRCG